MSRQIDRRKFIKIGAAAATTAGLVGCGVTKKFKGGEAPVPKSPNELIYLSADELLKLYKAKKVSPVEVLKAQIQQIEKVESKVNAVTYTHFKSAMKEALESENRYLRGRPRPLEGITIGVKDEFGKKGWIISQGSKLYKDARAKETHPLVSKLMEAGAVLHIQTTVPEFYLSGTTSTQLWGTTRNPWNLEHAAGGSSGGSGAALAAGMCTLAIGSDMGGSIRIPCAFNGLYGFKPPYGRVPGDGSTSFLFIATAGPMARTLVDTILFENVLAGPSPYSVTGIRPALELPTKYKGIRGMKIAYSEDQGWATIDADTLMNTRAAVATLREQGAVVEKIDLDLGIDARTLADAFSDAFLSGPQGEVLRQLEGDKDRMTPYAAYFVGKAASGKYGSKQALAYQEFVTRVYRQIQDMVFLQGYEALLMPTLATSHIPADFDHTQDKVTISGKSVHPLMGWILTPLFNLLNWNPVVNVPTGLSSLNTPTGMQIVAKSFDDATAFRVAAGYSKAAKPLFHGEMFPAMKTR